MKTRTGFIGLALAAVMAWAQPAQAQDVVAADIFRLMTGGCTLNSGSGTPENNVTANVCSIYLQTNGSLGNMIWLKTSGTGNTGWQVQPAGTVTSVGITVPSLMSGSGCTITTSGTCAITWNATANHVPFFSGSTTLATSTSFQFNGTNVTAPVFDGTTGFRVNGAAGSGQLFRCNGTNCVLSTFTVPDTIAQGGLFYGSATNAFSALAIGSTEGMILRTTSGGIPGWSTLIYPNAATANQVCYASATNTIVCGSSTLTFTPGSGGTLSGPAAINATSSVSASLSTFGAISSGYEGINFGNTDRVRIGRPFADTFRVSNHGDTAGFAFNLAGAADTMTVRNFANNAAGNILAAAIAGTTGTFSALTSGRVTFAGTGGLLSDDADLTFATDTLTGTKIDASTRLRATATGTRLTSSSITTRQQLSFLERYGTDWRIGTDGTTWITAFDTTGNVWMPLALKGSAVLVEAPMTTEGQATFEADVVAATNVKSSNYVSSTTGFNLNGPDGSGDFQFLKSKELRVDIFTAILEQALAGSMSVTKSVSKVYQDFLCPAKGGTATLAVEDLPGAANMNVFEANDYVVMRTYSRASGSLTIGDCVGVVTSPSTAPSGYQTWTFTRAVGANGGTASTDTEIEAGNVALDFGVSGNGIILQTAVDGAYGANSPYLQVAYWTGAPITANFTVPVRVGQLKGITGVSEYGAMFGNGDWTTSGKYFKATAAGVDLVNVPLSLYSSGTKTFYIDPAGPSWAMGNPLPSAYGTGTGCWSGFDAGVYKMRCGIPGGQGWFWNGTTLNINGNITVEGFVADDTNNVDGIPAATVASNSARAGLGLSSSGGVLLPVVAAPSGTGLFLGSDKLGFYTSSTWTNYMDNAGNFYLGGTSGALTYASGVLTITGADLNGDGAGITAINGGNITTDTVTATQIAANAITTSELNADSVTSAKIVAGTIVASDIASATITATQIAADTILAGNIAADAITTSELAADSVTSAKIVAGTIVATDIASGTITGTNIAATTITAANIAAGTITATQITADTITASQIAADAITTSELAADSVTSAKIVAGTIVASDIASATITATQIASATITAGNIAAATITTTQIASATITAGNIAANTITAGQIAADAIDTSELNANAVTSAKIAAGTIVASDIESGTITATQIASATITGTQIAATTITAVNIATDAITASKIEADAVTSDKIEAGAVTAAKIDVSELSAITADLGTVTAGSISGVTIQAGAGDEVILDADGLTIVDWVSDDKNALKWTGGAKIFGFGDTLALRGGAGAGINVGGGNQITIYADEIVVPGVSGGGFTGGGNKFVCADTSGVLYVQGSACDLAPSGSEIAKLQAEIAELKSLVVKLLSQGVGYERNPVVLRDPVRRQ